jgi:hypothetical protein
MVVYEPKFWRDRALEVGALERRINDPDAKHILSRIAEQYHEIAELAKDWAVPAPHPSSSRRTRS